VALHALSLLVNQRLVRDIEHYEQLADLHVVPPLCPLDVSPADFGQGADLLDRTYESTRVWLAEGGKDEGQARRLRPHVHAGEMM
jgi:NTE family protein